MFFQSSFLKHRQLGDIMSLHQQYDPTKIIAMDSNNDENDLDRMISCLYREFNTVDITPTYQWIKPSHQHTFEDPIT